MQLHAMPWAELMASTSCTLRYTVLLLFVIPKTFRKHHRRHHSYVVGGFGVATSPYLRALIICLSTSTTRKSLNSVGILDTVQETKFRKKRAEGYKGTRAHSMMSETPGEAERESLGRPWRQREMKIEKKSYERKIRVRDRVVKIEPSVKETKSHIARLESAIFRDTTSLTLCW